MKPKPAEADPPIVMAVEERPPSSVPDRVAVRIDGITYLIPADQVEGFKAKYAHKQKREARFDIS